MLKHRYIAPLFIILLTVLALIDYSHSLHWSFYLLLFVAFASIEFYGAAFIQSGFHIKALCKGNTQEQVIALTFDDGPVEQTEKILSVLDEFKVNATFFCIGHRIEGKEKILKKLKEKGHLIGNHSFSHGNLFDLKSKAAFMKDLSLCNQKIEAATGMVPAFFRPPYGVTTPALARAVKSMSFQVVGWNIRSLDTSIPDKNQVLERIKNRLRPGSIVLLHDPVAGTEIVLKDLLIYLRHQNYKVIPLDELIEKQAYA